MKLSVATAVKLTWTKASQVILSQQWTNKLQVSVDVLVDVQGPLVALMEPAEKLHC